MVIKLANKPLSINATGTHPTEGGTIASASLLTINLTALYARCAHLACTRCKPTRSMRVKPAHTGRGMGQWNSPTDKWFSSDL